MKKPKVEDAKKLAKKLDADMVIVYVFKYEQGDDLKTRRGNHVGYASYGRNKQLCGTAKRFADAIWNAIMANIT